MRLVEVHLRPLERQVEHRVGRLDRGQLLAEDASVLDPLPIIGLRVGEQAVVDGVQRVARHDAARDDDRDELGIAAIGVDCDAEDRGRVGRRVGRVRRAFRRERRADVGVVLAPALGEQEAPPVAQVDGVLAADPRWPHQVQVGLESGDDLQRLHRFHVEQHDQPGLVQRHEEVLAHGEGRVRVDDGHDLGPHDHAPSDAGAGDRLGVVGDLKSELEVVEQLQGPGPGLEAAGLVAEVRGLPADAAQVDARAGRSLELDGALGDVELGDALGSVYALSFPGRRAVEDSQGRAR